jgi:2-polyprenyl-6-hydroxyphenyl methylase/3-demethylubiquinone-9 3-methyltransferase
MNSSTDSTFSIASREFRWTDADKTTAHAYLVPAVIKILRAISPRTVLDLGCGNGSFSAVLQSQGFEVVGCDASESGIAFARQAHPGIEFFEHNVSESMPPLHAGPYDAVVSLEVVEHLMQPRQLVDGAHMALRPGGVLVISTPFHGYWKNLAIALLNRFDEHWHPLRDFGHVKFFSRKTLTRLLTEAGFTVKHFVRVGRIPAFACSMILVAIRMQ